MVEYGRGETRARGDRRSLIGLLDPFTSFISALHEAHTPKQYCHHSRPWRDKHGQSVLNRLYLPPSAKSRAISAPRQRRFRFRFPAISSGATACKCVGPPLMPTDLRADVEVRSRPVGSWQAGRNSAAQRRPIAQPTKRFVDFRAPRKPTAVSCNQGRPYANRVTRLAGGDASGDSPVDNSRGYSILN